MRRGGVWRILTGHRVVVGIVVFLAVLQDVLWVVHAVTTNTPTSQPSSSPSAEPTVTIKPTPLPSSVPTDRPTSTPSCDPSGQPTILPSRQPTGQPSSEPTQPTGQPSSRPSNTPLPSGQPSQQPTGCPTITIRPTRFTPPTSIPSSRPTGQPIGRPSSQPSSQPSYQPTSPTSQPSSVPSVMPSSQPSCGPTSVPTSAPSVPTSIPSSTPSRQPSSQPSCIPSAQPSGVPTVQPTIQPSLTPTLTKQPTGQPTTVPTKIPSMQPTSRPTGSPTFTTRPSAIPSSQPSSLPSVQPSMQPTSLPSGQPSFEPTAPTGQPSSFPSTQPTSQPSAQPSAQPTFLPSRQPSSQPSSQPTQPTSQPTCDPSGQPTGQPSTRPTITPLPSSQPTNRPSSLPSAQPQSSPTSIPTNTFRPTSFPTGVPSSRPSSRPTFDAFFGLTNRPTAFFENVDVSGTVTFEPDNLNSCNPVHMRFQFSFNQNITTGGDFVITASGLTNGACVNATDGSNIATVVTPNTDKFDVSYTEGSYTDGYANSQLRFGITGDDLVAGRTYDVVIDRENFIRRACSANQSWAVTLNPVGRTSGIVGYLDLVEAYPKRCYQYSSQLNFTLPYPQFFTGINMSLHLAYTVTSDTQVTIHLPGFSNAIGAFPLNVMRENQTQLIGNGANAILQNLTFSTNFSWSGQWIEGSYENTFRDSRIVLSALGFQPFTGEFWVMIPKENHIVATCGHQANSPDLQISTDGLYFIMNRTSVDVSEPIGPGCSQTLSNCNGHGQCDYCAAQCICDDGYGSVVDKLRVIADDFQPDCSSRACPYGPSLGNIVQYFEDINSTQSHMHRDMECSNNGVCDRKTGVCQCNAGFTGVACQKMACSTGLSKSSARAITGVSTSGSKVAVGITATTHLGDVTRLCSGRGRCLSMTRLAQTATALPLSSRVIDYRGENASFFHNTWDEDMGHTCVCDSSWEVGLQANQTQLAEYFGPGCEFRRCPSGDDPNTLTVNETNCEGINQTGGTFLREVGAAGNKCHIDCSNRGICDYSTGVCSCFPGYGGNNCGTLIRGSAR